MQNWAGTEVAREIRARTEALMDERSIAPTPTNYELWFFYALGHDQELRRALDAAVANGSATDAVRVKEIHTRFFVRADEHVEKAETQLTVQLKAVSSALATASGDVAAYGRALDETEARLPLAKSAVELKRLIEDTARATALMEARNKALETQVEASSRKLDEMRTQMEAVREQAMVDALTGLANRRAFDARLASAIKDAADEHGQLCVLMCDIDRFKTFNDTWGHATGDQVLRLVASAVKANVKGRDLAARYGGEELVVVLPKTILVDAIAVAEQIRTSIESKKIIKKSTGEALGQITISIGVAQYVSGELPEDFVSRADTHLYSAKRAGRNRVCWMPLSGNQDEGCSAVAPKPATRPPSGHKAALELEFADGDTPVLVDAEMKLTDERLIRLHEWWKSARPAAGLPLWRDQCFGEIAFVHDHAHLHEIQDASELIHIRFMGAAIVRSLGQDVTGHRYAAERSQSKALESTASRAFEMVSLTRRMKGPLHVRSKAVRHLQTGNFTFETLWLPFAGRDGEVAMVLGATIYAPVVGAKQQSGAAA